MHTPTPNGEKGPVQPGPLPNGLYVRESDEPDQATGQGEDARQRVTRRITGRNPAF